jgi:inner membrane protein
MDPITHFLTGACIGRAGLNRKTAYATVAAVWAAEAPDIDILWWFAGPVEELKHHRGITHTFLGAPFVAGAVVGAIWLFHRWQQKRKRRKMQAAMLKDPTAVGPPFHQPQPVDWGWLYVTALIAALSHILLDWTNNYGVRPFFPFNPRWYAGSFVFIVEPVMLTLLSMALLVPWLLGLADSEIGVRRKPFRGQGWAIFALVAIAALWCFRWAQQAQALAMIENSQIAAAPVTRVAMEPYPINPFRWHAILETADFYQFAEINSSSGSIDSDPQRDLLYKPPATEATEAAKRTLLGQVYLDWGKWATVRDLGKVPIPGSIPGLDAPDLPPNRPWSTVEFTDLRFGYSYLGAGRASSRAPLGGWVYIVDGRDDAGEAMSGRAQK